MDSSLALAADPFNINDTFLMIFTGVLAIATTLALFQDWFRSLFWHAKLKATIEARPPDSHKTTAYYGEEPAQFEAPCYYYRMRVENAGNVAAREVEVYATNVEKRTTSGEWQRVERFIPQYLTWSLVGVVLPILPPKASRHCDVGHIIHPKYRRNFHVVENDEKVGDDETILSLDVLPKALRRGHLLPKGEYRITLEVAASNAKPRTVVLYAHNPGVWHEDEATMLSDGTTISFGKAIERLD